MTGRDIMSLQCQAAAVDHSRPKNMKNQRMTVTGYGRSGTEINHHETQIIMDSSPMVKNEFLGTEGSPLQR